MNRFGSFLQFLAYGVGNKVVVSEGFGDWIRI